MNFSNAPKNQTENDKGQLTQNIDILKQLIDYPNLSRSLKMNSYGFTYCIYLCLSEQAIGYLILFVQKGLYNPMAVYMC